MLDAGKVRRELYDRHRAAFASVPIRLISKIDQEAREVFAAAGEVYDGYAGAIGDIAAGSLPAELRSALYFGREEVVRAEGERRLREETSRHTSYDFGGTGYACLKEAWRDVYRPLSAATDTFRAYPFYGGTHAFAMTIQAAARMQGEDEVKVLVPVPSFPPFFFQLGRHFAVICHATRPEDGLRLHARDIAGVSPDSLALVYICVVGNPTGLAYEAEELAELLAAIVARNPEALILLDAVYLRTLAPASAVALWRAMTAPPTHGNVAIFDSLSKTCGRTGLRSGVVFLNHPRWEQSLTDLAQNELAGLSYAMQIESIGLLRLVTDAAVQELAREIAGRRERFLATGLARFGHYFMPRRDQPLLPVEDWWQGGMYAFLQLQRHVRALDFFLDTGVACIPGAAFYGPGIELIGDPFVRISFGMEG